MQIFALKGNVPEIPDVAPAVRERARAVRARLDTFRRQSLPPNDQLPAIMDEQLERIRAFGLREGRSSGASRTSCIALVDRVAESP